MWNNNFTQYENYKGQLAEVRFWDRVKSPREIQETWMKSSIGTVPGLIGYFPHNENVGTSARDKLDPSWVMTLHNPQRKSWAVESPFN